MNITTEEQDGVWFKGVHGDCTRDVEKTIDPRSIDLIATSPPYKSKDGFSLYMMHGLALAARSALKKNGLIFLNIAQLTECPERPFKAMLCFLENGFKLRQTVIWEKSRIVDEILIGDDDKVRRNEDGDLVRAPAQRGHFQPLNSNYLVNYCHEYIFVLEKDTKQRRKFDRLAVGLEYSDKTNLTRGTRGKHGDLHCTGDVWWVPHATTGPTKSKNHEHQFPVEIPTRCIKLAGLKKKSTVWDPWLGGGSTAVAAKSLSMNFIGHDIDKEMIPLALERWKEV